MKQILSACHSIGAFLRFPSLTPTEGQHRSWVWLSEQMGREDRRTEGSLLQTTQILGSVDISIQHSDFDFYVSLQDCDSPPVIAHGHHKPINPSFPLRSVEATYRCDEGYTLVGKNKLSCSSSGWSSEAPQCKGNSSSLFSFVWGGTILKGLRAQFLLCQRQQKNIWFDLIYLKYLLYSDSTQSKKYRGHNRNINLSYFFLPGAKFSLCEAAPILCFLYTSRNILQLVHLIWV